MKHWVVTVLCWAFLAGVMGSFVWYTGSTLWQCTIGSCNESDASAVGGIVGIALLLGLPALIRRMRR